MSYKNTANLNESQQSIIDMQEIDQMDPSLSKMRNKS
jgi:hypothetical protein